MKKINFSLAPQALNDIQEIWLYVAQDNTPAANNLAGQFEKAFLTISENPYIGHRRNDLTNKPVRFWSVKNYLVIYNPETRPVQILRILSAYRDVTVLV